MSGYWIVAFKKGYRKGMNAAFIWILIRAVGNVLYVYGSVLFELLHIFSPSTRIASATFWLFVERRLPLGESSAAVRVSTEGSAAIPRRRRPPPMLWGSPLGFVRSLRASVRCRLGSPRVVAVHEKCYLFVCLRGRLLPGAPPWPIGFRLRGSLWRHQDGDDDHCRSYGAVTSGPLET
ncbi:uncharacterized protein ISCGN_008201 [Ixodes scapularis]